MIVSESEVENERERERDDCFGVSVSMDVSFAALHFNGK